MLVSASFLGSSNIPEALKRLNNTDVDYIHVDIMDGAYVEGKTIPFKQMRHLSRYTSKRLDVHLMVKRPSKYIRDYATLNTEYISIHPNIEEDVVVVLKEIKSYAIKAGLVINPDVLIQDIVPYLPYINLLLIMGVTPGRGGQGFLEETEAKVKEARILLQGYKEFPIKLSVDGGINQETISKVADADIVVSGSYLLQSESLDDAIKTLRIGEKSL